MLDARKKAQAAAATLLGPGEEVLSAMFVVQSPQLRFGGGVGIGMVTGGVVGAAVGAAVDRHFQKQDAAAAGQKGLAGRPAVEPPLPKVTGGLLAVTTARLLVWALSATNKPRELVHDFPLMAVDAVMWKRLAAGSPYAGGRINVGCTAIWIGLHGERVLPVASLGGLQEPNTVGVLEALTTRCPDRVREIAD